MKYTFIDTYDSFEDVQVGECFSFVNNSQFPQTTVFMKLPIVIHVGNEGELTYNSICLTNDKLYYVCGKEQIIIRDVELIVKKR